METRILRRAIWTVVSLWSLVAVVAGQTPDRAPVALDVPSRSNATPWVAAAGSFVAVAWGASAEARADVFVAVSRDGGASFGPPVQVNVVPGEARLGGESRLAWRWRRRRKAPSRSLSWPGWRVA
jgi:hypothetical protein